jgi:hypothetical protein
MKLPRIQIPLLAHEVQWALDRLRLAIISGVGAIEGKVRVTGNDQVLDYLASKLVAGANITLTVLNPGGVEQLRIDASGGGGGGNEGVWSHTGVAVGQLVHVSGADTVSPSLGTTPSGRSIVGFVSAVVGPVATVRYSGELSGFAGLVPGAQYFASPTVPGGIQTGIPVASGDIVRVVATAKNPTTLVITVSPDYMERA